MNYMLVDFELLVKRVCIYGGFFFGKNKIVGDKYLVIIKGIVESDLLKCFVILVVYLKNLFYW